MADRIQKFNQAGLDKFGKHHSNELFINMHGQHTVVLDKTGFVIHPWTQTNNAFYYEDAKVPWFDEIRVRKTQYNQLADTSKMTIEGYVRVIQVDDPVEETSTPEQVKFAKPKRKRITYTPKPQYEDDREREDNSSAFALFKEAKRAKDGGYSTDKW